MNNGEDISPMGIDLLINTKKVATGSPKHGGRRSATSSVKSIRIGKADSISSLNDSVTSDDIEVVMKRSPPRSESGDSKSSASSWDAPVRNVPPMMQQSLSPDEILDKKREMLYQFTRLEKKGVSLPRKYSMSSSLEEMKVELDRIKRDVEVDASVRFQRRMLMACVSGLEFMNHRFDPISAHLDGWSESVQESIGDYDDIFEELWDKYHSKVKMAPELRLMISLGGSAVFFHISHSMFKTMPGVDQVFRQNPELKKQFVSATMKTMNQNNNGGGGDSAADDGGGGGGGGLFGGLGNLMGGLFGGGGGGGGPAPPSGNMRGPTDVDDILNELQQERFNRTDDFEIFSNASEISVATEDAISMGTLLQDKGKRKKRRTLEL